MTKPSIMPILKEGSTDKNVLILQQYLKLMNLFSKTLTENFDNNTTKYIKEFQKKYGLVCDGVVGPKTWKKLFEVVDSSGGFPIAPDSKLKPFLNIESIGNYVGELQKELFQLGFYNNKITSIFDSETEKSVKTFQIVNNLTPDGEVGPETWSALYYLYSPLSNNNNDYIVHKVISQDTMWGLAKKYKTTVDVIKILNNLTSNILNIGQILKIPRNSGGNYMNYKVESGDSIWSIAQRFGVSVSAIRNLNNLAGNTLNFGQMLKIPSLASIGVSKNNVSQTPSTISSSGFFSSTTNSPVETNGEPININIKQAINVPNSNTYQSQATTNASSATASVSSSSYNSNGNMDYIIKDGDTLWILAKRYNTTVAAIKAASKITSDVLQTGQHLFIPMNGLSSGLESNNQNLSNNRFYYTVKSGDTLWILAKRYNTTVAAIKAASKITSDVLQIGQRLIIQNTSNSENSKISEPTTNRISYAVKSGDSLWLIARRYKTTVDEIIRINGLTSNLLSIGQILIIPL